eukprot:3759700-Heterocapsa_arctica.AAC.1
MPKLKVKRFISHASFLFAPKRAVNYPPVTLIELSSCPATLEAAKSVDAFGLLPGHDVEQCDAQQAYVQSKLGGTPTW